MICFCADQSILGTPFYIMEHVQACDPSHAVLLCVPRPPSYSPLNHHQSPQMPIVCLSFGILGPLRSPSGLPMCRLQSWQGRVFVDPALPGLHQDDRAAVYRGMAETLASLHSVRPGNVGLTGFGYAKNYCARQVGCLPRGAGGRGGVMGDQRGWSGQGQQDGHEKLAGDSGGKIRETRAKER